MVTDYSYKQSTIQSYRYLKDKKNVYMWMAPDSADL